MYQAFIWIFFLLVDFLRSLLVSIASCRQNITKMKFIINACHIPHWLRAGLCCLRINLTCILICCLCINSFAFLHILATEEKNTIATSNIIRRKIKPIILIMHENFNLKYLRVNFYYFFITFWPPVPKVILMLQWGWRQIVQQDMNSLPYLVLSFE